MTAPESPGPANARDAGPAPAPVAPDDATLVANLLAARARIAGVAHRTPVVTSRTLDREVGARVFLKAECLQRMGAFKFRGAWNAVRSLPPAVRARGVVTFSSGNHAQAVALAAKLHGVPAVIVMPSTAPAPKLAATRGYGAEVQFHDRLGETREGLAARLARERGLTLVPPFDHPDIVAGQGTAALELIEDVGGLDHLLVPVGGGGLLSGCAVAAFHASPGCRVTGVEPAAGDDGGQSFRAGQRVTLAAPPDTIADGARTTSVGELPFAIMRRHVHAMTCVSDAALIEAMRFVWERIKLVVEPTGVLGLAALRSGALAAPGARIGVILSGGNVDPAQARVWFGRRESPDSARR